MTLIELLVVVAIIGAFALAVVPNLASTIESRRGRESVRMLTTFISRAQNHAVGRREWSGFMIEALSGPQFAAVDLVPADVPPLYRGDTVPAVVMIRGDGATSRAAEWAGSAISSPAGVTTGDLIRFAGRDPWFEVASPPVPGVSGSIAFRLRGDLSGADEHGGYLPHNTPWPPATSTGVSFEIMRQPLRSGAAFTLPNARVIDLAHSGYGPPTSAGFRRFADLVEAGAPMASVAVLFDGTGRLRQIQLGGNGHSVQVVGGAAAIPAPWRLAVTGPLFLLVGRADRAGQPYNPAAGADQDGVGANWQYADSYWIAIDPFTGVTRAAECKPNAVGGDDMAKLIDSQNFVRQVLLTGGG